MAGGGLNPKLGSLIHTGGMVPYLESGGGGLVGTGIGLHVAAGSLALLVKRLCNQGSRLRSSRFARFPCLGFDLLGLGLRDLLGLDVRDLIS